jgi:uncharacterized protein
MRFEWDEAKNQRNLLKHHVRFETAFLAFDDAYALTLRDESSDEEERWITLGSVSLGAVFFIVHTCFERDGVEGMRIVSARTATPHERRSYEEAKQGAKTRHRRHLRDERRRH